MIDGKLKRSSITLKDVARLAGVSLGTASKVINGHETVSPILRMRVEAVVDKLGYRPSGPARSIKRNKTMVVGLIIPRIKNVFYIQVIEAIEKLVQSRDYTLILGNSDEDIETEIRYLRTFAAMRVDGLILASTGRNNLTRTLPEIETYKRLGIPIVLIVRSIPDASLDTITINNEEGAYLATKYALENGHTRIAIISSPAHTSASIERINGYLNALEEYGIPRNRNYVRIADVNSNSGYTITKELLRLEHPPSTLFVASNNPLLSSLEALRELNIRIPNDLSLICFDDPDWGPFLNPPLTAIRPSISELCNEAVNHLFDRINRNYNGMDRSVIIPTELIVRSSVLKSI